MAEHVIDKFTYGDDTYILNGDFVGAKTAVDGEHGLVPTPAAGETAKILWSDGNWKTMTPRLTISGSNLQLELLKQNDSGTTLMSSTTIAVNSFNYNAFGKVSAGGVTAVADLVQDTLTITGTDGITVTADANTDTITISGSGSGATVTDFVGTDSDEWGVGEDGVAGLVPAPPAGAKKAFLYGDGQWHGTWLAWDDNNHSIKAMYNDGTQNIAWGSAAIPLASTSTPGLINTNDKAKLNYLSTASIWYGTCNTVTATADKEITLSSSYWPLTTYTLKTGSIINVFFNYPNTTATPTINVNSTGAKPIRIGSAAPNDTDNQLMWDAGTLMSFIYDEAGDSGRGAYRYLTSVTYGTAYTQEYTSAEIAALTLTPSTV